MSHKKSTHTQKHVEKHQTKRVNTDANANTRANRAKRIAHITQSVEVQDTTQAANTAQISEALAQDAQAATAQAVTNTAQVVALQDALEAQRIDARNHKVSSFAVKDLIRFYCMHCKHAIDARVLEIKTTLQNHKRAYAVCDTCGKKVSRGHLDVTEKQA